MTRGLHAAHVEPVVAVVVGVVALAFAGLTIRRETARHAAALRGRGTPRLGPVDDTLLLVDTVDTLDTVGGSENAYVGSGTWKFNTATGGAEDISAAPASNGLHGVAEHGVGFNGGKFDVPFTTTVGSVMNATRRTTAARPIIPSRGPRRGVPAQTARVDSYW